MQPMKLYFDVRDIFRAPRLALSGKKIIVFIQANLIGYFAYWIFNYLGAMVHGVSFSDTWSMYGLYPCLLTIESLPLLPCILFWAGIVFWFFAISLGSTAVSRITYRQLKGDEFYSGSDAWNYVKRHWHPIIYSSISLLLILVFLFVVAGILGLIGKIPYVGEFLFVLPYLLYFFGSVFTIYTGIVLLVSLIYTPSIVATYEEDTMGTVWHNFSITWGQPWRMISYHFVLFDQRLSCFTLLCIDLLQVCPRFGNSNQPDMPRTVPLIPLRKSTQSLIIQIYVPNPFVPVCPSLCYFYHCPCFPAQNH